MTKHAQPVNVIAFRVGRLPSFELLEPDERGDHLRAMQRLVGGYVQCVTLTDELDLWMNEDGAGSEDGGPPVPLGFNRAFAARRRGLITPSPFEWDFIVKMNGAELRENGVWLVHGNCFVARRNDSDIASVDPVKDLPLLTELRARCEEIDLRYAQLMNQEGPIAR